MHHTREIIFEEQKFHSLLQFYTKNIAAALKVFTHCNFNNNISVDIAILNGYF